MIIPTMKYLGLRINKSALITLKIVNKRVVKIEGIINSVVITIMKISTIFDFHVVLKEDGAHLMIQGRPWLTKSHANNYWGKGYMTIGVHLN